jgi:hypothetical protein
MVVEIEERPQAKRRKIHREEVRPATTILTCPSGVSPRTVIPLNPISRHPPKLTARKLVASASAVMTERENALLKRERELGVKLANVEERLSSVVKKEEELRVRVAQNALQQLEDHFTCSLCYEIM